MMTKAEKIIELLDKELCLFARDFEDLEDFCDEVLNMITKIIESPS